MTPIEDARPVLEQWNASHGPASLLRESDLRWNLTAQDLVAYEATVLAGVPSIVAFAAPAGVRAGIAAHGMWVSLWGTVADGTEDEFLRAATDLARERGRTRVAFGADEFHFTPGIPLDESGRRLAEAAKRAGFDGAEAYDFTGSLGRTAVDEAVNGALTMCREHGWRFEPAETAADLDALDAFLATEFPGRWRREFAFWRSREDTGRAFWRVLRRTDDEILGFARLAVRGRVTPLGSGWTPGALRTPLAPAAPPKDDDGCLGPIGVAASQRGKGAGRVLLGLVLQALRQHRAERICIDWTNALKYYEPLQFERARQYWTAWKIGAD